MAKQETHTKAYYKALIYYPSAWSIDDLRRLVEAGRLRQDEFDELVVVDK